MLGSFSQLTESHILSVRFFSALMEQADILIKDAIIVTVDQDNRVFRGSIAIRGCEIAGVGRTSDLEKGFRADRVINAADKVALPGFINMHNHLRGSLTRNLRLTDGLKLDDLLKITWSMQEQMGREEYYVATLLTCIDNVKSGNTTVVDHCYPLHKVGLLEEIVRALGESGIRAVLARGLMTSGYEPICERSEDAYRAIEELIMNYRGKDTRLQIQIAPVSFRQSAPEDYRKSRDLADKHNVRLYTHVAETQEEVETIKSRFGKRPIEFLHDLGFLGPDVTLVHCVFLSEDEIHLLKQTRTNVVHCPSNHMRLAKGVTQVPRLLQEGINVSLGTDSPTIRQDMFVEMNNEILMQSLYHSDPSIMTPEKVLRMATVNGAIALGLCDELGSIEQGKKADIILVGLNKPHFRPVVDVVYSLVYSGHAEDVDTVLIDGRIIMENRKLSAFDEIPLFEKIEKLVREYVRKIGKGNLLEDY